MGALFWTHMLYQLNRLVKELRDSGRDFEADIFAKTLHFNLTQNRVTGKYSLIAYHPTIRPLAEDSELSTTGGATAELDPEMGIGIVFTKVNIPLEMRTSDDGVEFIPEYHAATFVAAPSVPTLLATHAGVDATDADKVYRSVSEWLRARWRKMHEGHRPVRITLSSDISKGYATAYDEGVTSCMAHGEGLKYIKLYDLNAPNIVQLATYRMSGKIRARCLIWGGKYYDHIYAVYGMEAKFRAELADNGLQSLSAPGVQFAAVMSVGEDHMVVPYMDTLETGCPLGDDRLLVATSAAAHSGKIEKLLGYKGSLSYMDYRTNNGGPYTGMCCIKGTSHPRHQMVSLDGRWFAPHFKTNHPMAVVKMFDGTVLRFPGLGTKDADLGTISAFFTNALGCTAAVQHDKGGTFELLAATPVGNYGSIIPIHDGTYRLAFVSGGSYRYVKMDTRPICGIPSVILNSDQVAEYGIGTIPVRDRGVEIGHVPSGLARIIPQSLHGGRHFVSLNGFSYPVLPNKPEIGVLLA